MARLANFGFKIKGSSQRRFRLEFLTPGIKGNLKESFFSTAEEVNSTKTVQPVAREAALGPKWLSLLRQDFTHFRVQLLAAELAPFTPVNYTFLEEKKKENRSGDKSGGNIEPPL